VIGVINYGLGNVHAFLDCFRILGHSVLEVSEPAQLSECSKLILPGVGSFDTAMQKLNDSGLREPLDNLAKSGAVDVLGVCVGLQMLFTRSDEGVERGLGWIPGQTHKLTSQPASRERVPHMGWNSVDIQQESPLFNQLQDPSFYFLHSYYVAPEDSGAILAITKYGSSFTVAVQSQNIWGVQFHPEKSHRSGLQLLQNFALI
jgi:glutamine amidotransferase